MKQVDRPILTALALLWSIAGLQAIAGYDVWWHLAAGREILATGTLLPFDTWSHTAANAPWPTKDVLAEILFQLLYAAAGPALLQSLKLVVPLAMLATMVTIMRRAGASWPVIAILCALAFPAASFRFIVRPVLFSLLMMVLYWHIIDIEDRKLRRHGRHHWAFVTLPLLQLVWIWTHREAMLGAALVGLYALDVLAGTLIGGRHTFKMRTGNKRTAITAVIAVTACVACTTLLGPAGPGVLAISAGAQTSQVLRAVVPNWGMADPMTLAQQFPTWLVLVLGVVMAILRGTPVRLWQALSVVGFIALGVWAIRFLPYLALTAPLVIAASTPWTLSPTATTIRNVIHSRWPATAFVIATTLVVLTTTFSSGRRYGFGFDERRYPTQAARFLQNHHIRGKLLNPLHWGGYLIHQQPTSRVFVDGRSDVIYPAEVIELSARAPHDPAALTEIMKRWPVDLIVSAYEVGASPYAYLEGHPDWVTIHWDERCLVIAHAPDPHDPIRGYALRDLSPFHPLESIEDALASGHDLTLERDVRRLVLDDPRSVMARFLMAYTLAASHPEDPRLDAHIAVIRRLMPSFGGIDMVTARRQASRFLVDKAAP